jgi:hypothetical protein
MPRRPGVGWDGSDCGFGSGIGTGSDAAVVGADGTGEDPLGSGVVPAPGNGPDGGMGGINGAGAAGAGGVGLNSGAPAVVVTPAAGPVRMPASSSRRFLANPGSGCSR